MPLTWLRADSAVIQNNGSAATNGSKVLRWTNPGTSSAGNASQGSGNLQPTFYAGSSTSAINFNPTVTFNNDELHLGQVELGQGGGNWSTIAVTKQSAKGYLLGRKGASTGNYAFTFQVGPSGARRLGSLIVQNTAAADQPQIDNHALINEVYRAGSSYTAAIDGRPGESATYTPGYTYNVSYDLGRASDGTPHFDGSCSELVIYNATLTAVQRQKVDTYLALKYGITLGTPAAPIDYVAANGTTVWTGSATYQHNVFGVARENASALNQQISMSQESANNVLVLSTDNNFTAANRSHAAVATDASYLIVGDDGASLSWQATEVSLTTFTGRIGREWRVQKTGFSQAVNMKFLGLAAGAQYYLLRNTTSDFSSITVPVGTLNNGVITGVSFNNGDYFTLAVKRAPGGVMGMELWVMGDTGTSSMSSGAAVSQWLDQSMRAHPLAQATGSLQPTYSTASVNFNPSVVFDGVDDNLGRADILGGSNAELSSFIVAQESVRQNNTLFTFRTNTSPPYAGHYPQADNNVYWECGAAAPPEQVAAAAGFSAGTPTVGTFINSAGGNKQRLLVNGQVVASDNTGHAVATDNCQLGGLAGAGYYKGNVPEWVVYPNVLSAADQQKVQSYLAFKYGVTLTNDNNNNGTINEPIPGTSNYEGDYVASDGTVIWPGLGNTGYTHNVVGVGRDNVSGLHQRIGWSEQPGTILTVSTDKDFVLPNKQHPAISNDLSFLIIGSDTGSTALQTTEMNTAFFDARVGREWKVQKTNFGQAVNLKFTGFSTSPGILWLVLRSSTSDFSGVTTYLASLNASGVATNVVLNNGEYLTLARRIICPGGVPNYAEWLKADNGTFSDAGVTATTANVSIQQWNTTYFGVNATQTTATDKPLWRIGTSALAINFNPSVDFVSNDELHFGTNFGISATNPFTVFAASKTSTANGRIFGDIATAAGSYEMRVDNCTALAAGTAIATSNGTANAEGGGVPYLSYTSRTGNNFTAAVNGRAGATASNATSFTATSYDLGSAYNTATYFKGQLGDFVVYSSALSATDRLRVESYLALKYGVTLGTPAQPLDYLASFGTTIWSADPTYQNNVTGIGSDVLSGLEQQISTSQEANAIVTLSTDNNFTGANGTHVAIDEPNTFLLIGQDVGALTLQTTEVDLSAFTGRIGREWKVRSTGLLQTVGLKFAGFASAPGNVYYLLRNTTSDFTNASDVLGALDANGEIWNITLNDGDYFTLANIAQGPGGVAGYREWLRADGAVFSDAGVTNTTEGDPVQQWNTEGNGVNATQTTVADQPVWHDGAAAQALNFNPSVQFVSNDELHFGNNLGLTGTAAFTVFSTTAQTTQNGRFLGPTAASASAYEMRVGNCSTGQQSGTIIATSNATAGAECSGVPYVNFTMRSGNTHSAAVDGRALVSATNSASFTSTTLDLGSSGNAATYFTGLCGEFAAYNSALTAADRLRVQSYLGLKYGITMGTTAAPVNYVDSRGSVIWTGSSTYQNNVFGIGRDFASNFEQQIARSQDGTDPLIISSDNDFSDPNGEHQSLEQNDSFLLVGNDGASTAEQTTEVDLTVFIGRIGREWTAQATNITQPVSLKFSGYRSTSADTWFLLKNSTNNFSAVTTPVGALDTAGVISGVTLTSGDYFTLAHRTTAPGGSLAQLALWNKADAGVSTSGSNATGWKDQVARNNFSVQGTPQVVPSGMNYQPVMRADGASYFQGSDTIVNATEFYAVGRIVNNTSGTVTGALFGSAGAVNDNYAFHTENGTLYAGNLGAYANTNALGNNVGPGLFALDLSQTPAANQQLMFNGRQYPNGGADPVPYSRVPTLGSRGSEPLLTNSELAEAIIYTSARSATDRLKIQSYLALKYGLTLSKDNDGDGTSNEPVSTTAFYEGDYVASNGTVLWASANGTAYHNGIIGVARDDRSGLLQKQSKQADDSTRIYLGTLAATNAANGATFTANMQAVVMGHNGGQLRAAAPSNTERPTGVGLYNRIDREWKVTNTAFPGTFALDVKLNTTPINPGDLRLLVDDDGNFTNAGVYGTAAGLTFAYSGGVVTVGGISTALIPMNGTRYITIATTSINSPLPIELLDFTAKAEGPHTVRLDWHTASEQNNDHFTVERSRNTSDWELVTTVPGAGNSSHAIAYTALDEHAYTGVSYYRLKQSDVDGAYTYSPIRVVDLGVATTEDVQLFPNPTSAVVYAYGAQPLLDQVRVEDLTGRTVLRSQAVVYESDRLARIDLSGLPNGMYVVRTNEFAGRVMKQ